MKRVISSILACALLIAPTAPAYADDSTAPPSVSPLKKGGIAPFPGVLLSPEATAKLIVDLNSRESETQLQVQHAVDTQKANDDLTIANLKADLEYEKSASDVQAKSRDDQIKVLTQRLNEVESKNATSSPAPWVAGGVIGGIVMTLATVFAVSRVTH